MLTLTGSLAGDQGVIDVREGEGKPAQQLVGKSLRMSASRCGDRTADAGIRKDRTVLRIATFGMPSDATAIL